MRRHTRPAEPEWGRNKLVALLAGAVTVVLLLVVGLVLAVHYTLNPPRPAAAGKRQAGEAAAANANAAPSASTGGSAPGSGDPASKAGRTARDEAARDELADRPLPVVDLGESRPGAVSARDPGAIIVPASTTIGAAGVPSGFPHTPEGALGQLAAIDQTAMQSGSLDGIRQVVTAWAAPGGPTPESWSVVRAMAEFYQSAGLSAGGSNKMSLTVTPLMGMIKGRVGTDFVVPCIDFEFAATLSQTQRVAGADCQRMVWEGTRWVIGPGPEPAPAPSVWPGTDKAIEVGYKDLRRG